MKALPTLIRIAKRDLDALRQELGEVVRRRAEVDVRLAAHAEALANEQRLALQNYEAGRAYGGFAAFALTQKRALAAQGAALDEEAERIRALVAAAYIELKKVERLMELQADRAALAARREEDAELDEIATLRAGRKSTSG